VKDGKRPPQRHREHREICMGESFFSLKIFSLSVSLALPPRSPFVVNVYRIVDNLLSGAAAGPCSPQPKLAGTPAVALPPWSRV
jgi:hypothetical protein